jgi:hypothetical protein
MSGKPMLYVGAAILFLIGVCLFSYGVVNYIASTASPSNSNLVSAALGFGIVGVLFLVGGAGLAYAGTRAGKTEVVQQVTMNVDLPGNTQISQVTCRNCGGALKPENIKMVAGAPMVECPYCGTTYQMTEEPKW